MHKIKYLIMLFLLLGITNDCLSFSQNEKNEFNTIFRKIKKIKNDSLRVNELTVVYPSLLNKKWVYDFFDKTLHDINWSEKYKYKLFYIYMNYSNGVTDHDYIVKIMPEIKENAFKVKKYYSYFRGKVLLLTFEILKGKNEYVASQAKLMEKEAEKLSCLDGYVSSQMVLIDLYSNLNKNDKVLEVCNNLILLKGIDSRDLITAYVYKAIIYVDAGDRLNALKQLSLFKKSLDEQYNIAPDNLKPYYIPNYYYMELLYAKLYNNINDLTLLKKHLQNASDLKLSNILPTHVILYHQLLADYYKKTNNLDKENSEYKFLLEYCQDNSESPISTIYYKKEIASIYYKKGDYNKSFVMFDSLIDKSNVTYDELMRYQHETIKDNYLMEQIKIKAESEKHIFFYFLIICSVIIILILLVFIYRLLVIKKRISNNENIISKSCQLAKENNKLKETFIKNIRSEIEYPLNSVLDISKKISEESLLTKTELSDFSVKLEEETSNLIGLVENVLFLSRLESGMMNFDIKEYNLNNLCLDIIAVIEENEIDNYVDFRISDDSIMINVDAQCFKRFISSMLSKSGIDLECHNASLEIEKSIENETKRIDIEIKNSPLLESVSDNTIIQVKKQINNFIIKEFNWNCNYNNDNKTLQIVILE